MKNGFFLFVVIMFLSGCAGTQQKLVDRLVHGSGADLPKFTFASGTRVGIINIVDKQLTHQNFKSFSKSDSFTKKYDVGWNHPAKISAYIESVLTEDGRYQIVSLPVPSSLQSYQSGQQPGEISGLYKEQPLSKIRQEVDQLAQKHNVQVVIIAGNHFLLSNDNSIYFVGYGLYTHRGYSESLTKIFGDVYTIVGIGVQVYHANPITYIGGGRPSIPYVAQFPWNEDISDIPLADFDSIRPIIEGESEKIVMRALKQANLITE